MDLMVAAMVIMVGYIDGLSVGDGRWQCHAGARILTLFRTLVVVFFVQLSNFY